MSKVFKQASIGGLQILKIPLPRERLAFIIHKELLEIKKNTVSPVEDCQRMNKNQQSPEEGSHDPYFTHGTGFGFCTIREAHSRAALNVGFHLSDGQALRCLTAGHTARTKCQDRTRVHPMMGPCCFWELTAWPVWARMSHTLLTDCSIHCEERTRPCGRVATGEGARGAGHRWMVLMLEAAVPPSPWHSHFLPLRKEASEE